MHLGSQSVLFLSISTIVRVKFGKIGDEIIYRDYNRIVRAEYFDHSETLVVLHSRPTSLVVVDLKNGNTKTVVDMPTSLIANSPVLAVSADRRLLAWQTKAQEIKTAKMRNTLGAPKRFPVSFVFCTSLTFIGECVAASAQDKVYVLSKQFKILAVLSLDANNSYPFSISGMKYRCESRINTLLAVDSARLSIPDMQIATLFLDVNRRSVARKTHRAIKLRAYVDNGKNS